MRIAGLRRYPVKSMLGESVGRIHVGEQGLDRDRRFALIEVATGLVASAKQPSKWERLLQCSAGALDEGGVQITLPSGATTSSDAPDVDAVLSAYAGREVTLSAEPPPDPRLERQWPAVPGLAPAEVVRPDPYDTPMASGAPGTFFDYAPVHLVTTSALDALRAAGGDVFDAGRFRPNLVVSTPDEGHVENHWIGRHLQLGDEVVLEIVKHSPRCAVPALAHGDLPRNPDVLRTVVANNRVQLDAGRFACVGVYARVIQGGVISVGDDADLR